MFSSKAFFAICGVLSLSSASPIAFPQGTGTGSDSCPSDPLSVDTWKNLDLDTFLKNWSAANVTTTTTNNVQSLADSFGAPNFFCGLDLFCNAGQPCLPISLPSWYIMVSIQNWNSYMNSLNTAIGFASSIASLTLPSVVADFYPKPKDDITPLQTMSKVFTTVLGMVPFTGAVSTATGVVTSSVTFLTGRLKVPTQPDRFMAWSDVSSSLGQVLSDYQANVATSLKSTLDTKVNETGGINELLNGGAFLGVAQNFTQTDLQSQVTDSIKTYSIGLVLQARKVFIYRYPKGCENKDDDTYELCVDDGAGNQAGYMMLAADGDSNAEPQFDATKLLLEKYGLTKEQFLKGPAECFDKNGRKQLVDPFTDVLPLDKGTPCLFNLQVCGQGDGNWESFTKGIVDNCRDAQGLDI